MDSISKTDEITKLTILPTITGYQYEIKLKANVSPSIQREWPILFVMREAVEKQIKKLLKQGVIGKVSKPNGHHQLLLPRKSWVK